jgi:microcystin-dependent protein
MANIPLPSNIVFTRSGDSLFENVTIWGNTNLNTLNIYGEALFYENATFKKDVTVGGEFKYDNLSVKNLEVTEKGTLGILTVTGNSTLENVKISSGIVTASSGIVTYYGDGSNLDVDGSSLSESISSVVPAGSVFYFASSSTPTGYLKANGAELNKTTYAALFSSIGTTYGETNGAGGVGTSHFRVPDLRGEFLRGWDDGRGIDSGRSFGSTQSDEFKNHQHQFGSDDQVGSQGGYTTLGSFNYDATSTTSGSGKQLRTKNDSTNFGGTETRPRNLALLTCIKY